MQELAGRADGRTWRPAELDPTGYEDDSFLGLQPQSGADDAFLQSVLSEFLTSGPSLPFPSSASSPEDTKPVIPLPAAAAVCGTFATADASITPDWLQDAAPWSLGPHALVSVSTPAGMGHWLRWCKPVIMDRA